MFGAKYSRLTFWIWSVILIILFSIFSGFNRAVETSPDMTNLSLLFSGLQLIVTIMWINALANRIRDYGSNPWISLFSLIPLVNIGLALYYGIVKYKEKPEDEIKIINVSDPSLSKAVLNHAKEVASEVKPMIEKYKQDHATTVQSVDSINDDKIYEQALLEIEEDKKVKAIWARALSQSEGDKGKAEALYITFRVSNLLQVSPEKKEVQPESISEEKENINTVKEMEDRSREIQVALSAYEKENIKTYKEGTIEKFIHDNGLYITKKISDTEYIACRQSSPLDYKVIYVDNQWKFKDSK